MSGIIRSKWVSGICALLAFGHYAQAAADPASAPVPPAPTAGISVAHSALLTIDATPTDDSLEFHIRRTRDKSIVASEDVTVTVDGKNEPVTREKAGSYQLPIGDLRGDGSRAIEIVVGHDGIREILSGKIALPETSTAGSLMRDHKQIAWWILNIVIVLIAAIAISRRKA